MKKIKRLQIVVLCGHFAKEDTEADEDFILCSNSKDLNPSFLIAV
jgi:hypothetical protein